MTRMETPFNGLLVLKPKIHLDERGHFMESFRTSFFQDLGYNFIQDNQAKSSFGVIRGLHFQKPPHAQAKLVRVVEGRILDVVVDLRRASATYSKAYSIELSAEGKEQLLVPKGFAHGYVVLSSTATVFYKVDAYYNTVADSGVYYDDFGVDWQIPTTERLLSPKDRSQPRFSELNSPF